MNTEIEICRFLTFSGYLRNSILLEIASMTHF